MHSNKLKKPNGIYYNVIQGRVLFKRPQTNLTSREVRKYNHLMHNPTYMKKLKSKSTDVNSDKFLLDSMKVNNRLKNQFQDYDIKLE